MTQPTDVADVPALLTMDDVNTVRGHAFYLRTVRKEQDMPAYFDGLADRIAREIAARTPA